MPDASGLLARNIDDLTAALRAALALREQVDQAAQLLRRCLLGGGRVLGFGNGGSAADVADFCTEFACRFTGDRDPYAAIDLSASSATVTATANDYGYDQVFARQVQAYGRPGDVAVGVTTSGNSQNVLLALRRAKELGLATVALLGRDGGRCLGVADVELRVASQTTARVQEVHKLLLHTLCEAVEDDLARKEA